ncbi:hypothetical protein [Pseudomonas sp. C11]|uniref:hypothetical protein n=1 Tax=Pseudomonas sp. C11 TaxID=3075550 RepID=UPI002AFE4A96|nr:hypothetical protein [Pseudomonas sp. C11]
MNLLAQQALSRALARGARPVPAAEVLPAAPVPAPVPAPIADGGHFDRVGYLEGRKHALDIVRDGRLLLELQGGRSQLADRLRQCMQSKPASFAQGVASIIALVQEVAQ